MAKQWMVALGMLVLAVSGIIAWNALYTETEAESRRERPASKVNTASPTLDLVTDSVSAVGTLRARDQIALTTELSGRVVALNLRSGSRVTKGELLLRLDDRQARADLQMAEATFEDFQRQLQRAQSLQSKNSISQSRVDELRTAAEVAAAQRLSAQTRVDNHRIVAPFEGVIGLNDVSIGMFLTAGVEIATLDSTDQMRLDFAIPEKFLGQIRPGQLVQGHSPAYPEEHFRGELVELGTRIDERSRTLPARALIDNPDSKLRPGQFMAASLTLRQRKALIIPEQAVMLRGDESYVFVASDGIARRTPVELGTRSPGVVEVVSGLSLDDQIIITGQDRLSSGERINVVEDTAAIPDNQFVNARKSDQ